MAAPYIYEWCDWLKVLWINARSHSTEVVKLESGGDRADMEFVDVSGCLDTLRVSYVPQKPIAFARDCSLPDPARGRVSSIFDRVAAFDRLPFAKAALIVSG